ncbi:uncharacterized protein LOC142052485 [Phalacrocorax aristotelis]|uniref:uncharacterized protein LOC142052485 n=1 Tax=Phalacrocorax aristotelis TaxID=126867 RepID=UPI003F4C6372
MNSPKVMFGGQERGSPPPGEGGPGRRRGRKEAQGWLRWTGGGFAPRIGPRRSCFGNPQRNERMPGQLRGGGGDKRSSAAGCAGGRTESIASAGRTPAACFASAFGFQCPPFIPEDSAFAWRSPRRCLWCFPGHRRPPPGALRPRPWAGTSFRERPGGARPPAPACWRRPDRSLRTVLGAGDRQLGSASSTCSLSFCMFLHSFPPFLPLFSRSLRSSLCSLSLAFPGAGSLPPIPDSGWAQKRCLGLQAAEPGRKIWSDEGRNPSFSSGHTPPLPLPLIGLLVDQAQKNAADFGSIPRSVPVQRRIMKGLFLHTASWDFFPNREGLRRFVRKPVRDVAAKKNIVKPGRLTQQLRKQNAKALSLIVLPVVLSGIDASQCHLPRASSKTKVSHGSTNILGGFCSSAREILKAFVPFQTGDVKLGDVERAVRA